MSDPSRAARAQALANIDWQQVVLNGGPPCFHLELERQRFCLRAERWQGHGSLDHKFVSLADLLNAFATQAGQTCETEQLLRAEWWSNHGCPLAARYGDDGEMQCNAAGCMTDFRRMPLDELLKRVDERRRLAFAKCAGWTPKEDA